MALRIRNRGSKSTPVSLALRPSPSAIPVKIQRMSEGSRQKYHRASMATVKVTAAKRSVVAKAAEARKFGEKANRTTVMINPSLPNWVQEKCDIKAPKRRAAKMIGSRLKSSSRSTFTPLFQTNSWTSWSGDWIDHEGRLITSGSVDSSG